MNLPTSQSGPLDVAAAIVQRRAIKNFKPDEIPLALLHQLVDLTIAAPSSFNLQSWRIVLVQDEAQKAALSAACWGQPQITQAPVTFVFAADSDAWKEDRTAFYETAVQLGNLTPQAVEYLQDAIPQFQSALGEKNREYAVKDAMIAATHLVLAAQSYGLATCFMNGWVEDQVKAVIGAADQPNIAIAVVIPVGFAAEPRKDPGRYPVSHNVFVDRLSNPYGS
ncbi:nitroreductase family protein [Phormidesmis sp. 146-35]